MTRFLNTNPLRRALLPLVFLAVVLCSFSIGVRYRTLRGAADGGSSDPIGHHECTAIVASALQERSLVLTLGSSEYEASSVMEEADALVEAEIWNSLDPSPDDDLLTYQDDLLNALRYRDTILLVTGDEPEGRVARGEPASDNERTARLARGVAIAAFVAHHARSRSESARSTLRNWDLYLTLLENDPQRLQAVIAVYTLRNALRFVADVEASRADCGAGPEGDLTPLDAAVDRVLLQGRSILASGPDENSQVPSRDDFLASLYSLLTELRHARDLLRLRQQEEEAARRRDAPTPTPLPRPTATATPIPTPLPSPTASRSAASGGLRPLPVVAAKPGKQLPVRTRK